MSTKSWDTMEGSYDVVLDDMARSARDRPTLPTPMENLLPLPLRRAYMTDNVVNVAFQRAARNNVTREQALIDAVILLSDDRQRLLAEFTRITREQPPRLPASGAPGHMFCDYEDCDQEPTVTLPPGAVMCEHHAAVSLLAGMNAEEARSTFAFARPVTEHPSPPVPGDAGPHVPADTIHIVHEGRALCGKPGVPGGIHWQADHKSTSWDERANATCDECLSAAWKRLPTPADEAGRT